MRRHTGDQHIRVFRLGRVRAKRAQQQGQFIRAQPIEQTRLPAESAGCCYTERIQRMPCLEVAEESI